MALDDGMKLCQVCGSPLQGALVRCVLCDTPHHGDCWRWNGGCSTYGCGSKQARDLSAGQPTTTADDPPPVVALEAPPGVADEPPAPPPALVIDDAFPGEPLPVALVPPAAPGLLETVALPLVSWTARQAAHLGLNLAVLAVKLAAGLVYLAVVPGSGFWQAIFGLSDMQFENGGRRARPSGLEGALATAVGPAGYGCLTYIATFVAVMAVAGSVVASNPGFEWLLVPLAGYLVLSPFLTPLMEDLAGLPLPGFPVGSIDPGRLAALEEDRAERRLRRRLPPTEPGAPPSRPGRRSKRKGARKRRRRF